MAKKTFLSEDCKESLRSKKTNVAGTWRRVADDLAISENQLYRMLNGSRGAGIEIAKHLSSYLGLPIDKVTHS